MNNSGNGPSPLGKATSVAWGGTYSLNADPVQPWKGLYNWDTPFPQGVYTPATLDKSWGRNRPGMYDPRYGLSPYVQMWNLNIQREVARNLVLDVGYFANKGTGLRDGQLAIINQLPTSVLSTHAGRAAQWSRAGRAISLRAARGRALEGTCRNPRERDSLSARVADRRERADAAGGFRSDRPGL